MGIGLFIIYLCCTVGGIICIKLGSASTNLGLSDGLLSLKAPLVSVLGMILYIVSFILWMVLISASDLSYIVPVAMGLTQVLVVAASVVIFREPINIYQWIGIFVVIIGVVLLNIKK